MKVLDWATCIAVTVISFFIGWSVGDWIGESLLQTYRDTGELVTAKDVFELNEYTPFIFALVFAYGGYTITKPNKN